MAGFFVVVSGVGVITALGGWSDRIRTHAFPIEPSLRLPHGKIGNKAEVELTKRQASSGLGPKPVHYGEIDPAQPLEPGFAFGRFGGKPCLDVAPMKPQQQLRNRRSRLARRQAASLLRPVDDLGQGAADLFTPFDDAPGLRPQHLRLLDLQEENFVDAEAPDDGIALEVFVDWAENPEQLVDYGLFGGQVPNRGIHHLIEVIVENQKEQVALFGGVNEQGADRDLGAGSDLAGRRPLVTPLEKDLVSGLAQPAAALALAARPQPLLDQRAVGLFNLEATH